MGRAIVYFKNTTWRVTRYGLEANWKTGGVPRYEIKADRLLEVWNGKTDKPYYGWPRHMIEKDWVRYGDFVEAWKVTSSKRGKRRSKFM